MEWNWVKLTYKLRRYVFSEIENTLSDLATFYTMIDFYGSNFDLRAQALPGFLCA